jgi:hypothetical protein
MDLGWGPFSTLQVRRWWLIDREPDLPRLAIQGVLLAVAVGLLLTATLQVRESLRLAVARREARADRRNLTAVAAHDGADVPGAIPDLREAIRPGPLDGQP